MISLRSTFKPNVFTSSSFCAQDINPLLLRNYCLVHVLLQSQFDLDSISIIVYMIWLRKTKKDMHVLNLSLRKHDASWNVWRRRCLKKKNKEGFIAFIGLKGLRFQSNERVYENIGQGWRSTSTRTFRVLRVLGIPNK